MNIMNDQVNMDSHLDAARRSGDQSGADTLKGRPLPSTENEHLNFFRSQAFDGALAGGARDSHAQSRDRAESGRLNLLMPSTPHTHLGAPKAAHEHGSALHQGGAHGSSSRGPTFSHKGERDNISATITPMAARRFSGRIEYNIALPQDIPNHVAAEASKNEDMVADRHVCDLVGAMYEDEEPESGVRPYNLEGGSAEELS